MLLAPGAGGSADSLAILELAAAVRDLGIAVRRMDFPYRLAGRRRPDPGPVLEAAVCDQAADFAAELGVGTREIVLGGRSMGGRICSLAVAKGLPAAGLALVSYPLHPPGRPDQLRTAHFSDLLVPCLFVSGTRDAFGTRGELEASSNEVRGPVSRVWVEGGDHGLRRRERDAARAVAGWLETTFRLRTQRGTPSP